MISIILPISLFDNISHDAKPSRISHNSIISWHDLLYSGSNKNPDLLLFYQKRTNESEMAKQITKYS